MYREEVDMWINKLRNCPRPMILIDEKQRLELADLIEDMVESIDYLKEKNIGG